MVFVGWVMNAFMELVGNHAKSPAVLSSLTAKVDNF